MSAPARKIRISPVKVKPRPGEIRTEDACKVLTDTPFSPVLRKDQPRPQQVTRPVRT
jgi:hypothetical protein